MLFFNGISTLSYSLLQRNLKFRLLVNIEIFSYLFGYGVVAISLAFLNYGAWALVLSQLTHSIVQCSLLLAFSPHPKKLQYNKNASKELINFGGGITLGNIFNYFARNGDYLIVGRFLGAEALGYYSRAYKLMTLPATILGNVMDRVLFPSIAKVQKDISELNILYKRSILIISLVSLPMSGLMFVLAPEIVNFVLGKGWEAAVSPFRILSLGALFRTGYKVSEALARAKGKVYKIAWAQLGYALLIIMGALIGKFWGISGVAFGVLAAIIVVYFLLSEIALSSTYQTYRQFFSFHFPAIVLGSILFAEAYVIALALRSLSFSSLIILFVCLAFSVITLEMLYFLAPRISLRSEKEWIIKELTSYAISPKYKN